VVDIYRLVKNSSEKRDHMSKRLSYGVNKVPKLY